MQNQTDEKFWIIAWAGAPGIALLLLHEWAERLAEPVRYFWLLWPLYAVVLWLPLSMQLLAQQRREAYFGPIIGSFIAALTAMGAYKGWTTWTPNISVSDYWLSSAAISIFTAAALWFVLLPFAQSRLQRGIWKPDYPFLFAAAWRNSLQLASAAAFTGVLWLLLGLWAGLFTMLNIKTFANLFSSRFFIYPTTSIAFSLGLLLYRSREIAIQGVYRTLLQIMGWLLPLAALLAVCFLAVLPVTGLQPLWKTGHAGALLLILQGFLLLLFNAAWQDGNSEALPPRWLQRPISWAMALLPVYAGLNAYALELRVDQYGWSAERLWAALLIAVAGFFGLGYAFVALRRNTSWMAGVAQVNIAAALLSAALLAATATPLLDPERIGVVSQVSRLLSGKVAADTFDYHYLRFNAGRYGAEALQRLSVLDGHPQAEEIRKKAVAMQQQKDRYGANSRRDWTARQIAAQLPVYPQGATADPSFFQFLSTLVNSQPWSCPCLQENSGQCLLLVMDLNRDGEAEHILISNAYTQEVYKRSGKNWLRAGDFVLQSGSADNFESIKRDLAEGKLRLLEPEWQDLEIGGKQYRIRH